MIKPMKEINGLNLDGRLLQTLVAAVEEGSITGAAQALGLTQSAVSHQLERLRVITGDALFVKRGRGVIATARARALAVRARDLLRQMQDFTHAGAFEPAQWRAEITLAANDFQRDVLLPALAARLSARAPGVSLRVIPSDVPTLEMLREGVCDLVISPRPPEGADILQQRLFEDRWRVFYDPAVRVAPASRAEYLASDHITVVYAPRRSLDLDRVLASRGLRRRFAVMVPGFAGMPAFLRGTARLATAPARLAQGLMRDFAHAPVPVPCPPLPMFQIWHLSRQDEAAHRWLRAELKAVAASVPAV